MDLLLKNGRLILDTERSEPQDLLIRDGLIAAIGTGLQAEKTEVWDLAGACVSPGWLDVGVQAADPGFEHREDLHSVSRAAARGGYTAIACFPNTEPALHSKSEILYVLNKTAASPVAVYPIGALSLDCAGQDLAELYDMHAAGAVAFSDGHKPVQDAGLLLRAMQYARAFDGLIMNAPQHKSIAAGGQMHEGVTSTKLGLKGLPALAEELMVQRDLRLLEYAAGRLHLHLVSTAGSVEMIRRAKAAGLPVTASVAVANLCFTDEVILGEGPFPGAAFDSNWKILPPLRTATDVEALIEGLLDGTIDFIASNHTPWNDEAKNLEFPYADFGMIALETAFALCRTFLHAQLSLPQLVEKLALAPRRILGLPEVGILPEMPANLTIFDPEQEWTLNVQHLASKSRNTPLIGHTLRGKILGIVHRNQLVRNF
ncbi:MAG: dihydroorotase [Saprospiraceae bacterium]